MGKKNKGKEKEKRTYIVALPDITMIRGIPEYNEISHYGTTQSTTARGATGNLLHRQLPRDIARLIQGYLNKHNGGTGQYALPLREKYFDEEGKPLDERDAYYAGVIEICELIEYAKSGKNRRISSQRNIDLAERLLSELESKSV